MTLFLFSICFFMINLIQATPWKNWAGNQKCNAIIAIPETFQEVSQIIKKAKKEKLKVRAYGSGHSWSDIICSDGILINTDKLNKIIAIDKKNNQVTVQAGIRLYDLNKHLAKMGLCLPNQGAITEQSIAGVINTATHGSGKTGTFASFITHVSLITADGKELKFSKQEHKELFAAIRTSIGSLGVMTEVTIQCEPLFKVHRQKKKISWDEWIRTYKKLLHDNDFMEATWSTGDDELVVIMHNKVTDEQIKKNPALKNSNYGYKLLSGILPIKYLEEEIAIPFDNYEQAAIVAKQLVTKEFQATTNFSDILFRFVSAEKDNLLSPAADQDVVYFSIVTLHKTHYENFYKRFYDAMLPFKGRPHWGKINFLTYDDALMLYGKNFKQFIKIRKILDPEGLFSNSFTQKVLGY